MIDNSSKFFRKILKNSFLVTASGAAIMLSSSGALAAAVIDVTADVAALKVGDGTSLSAPWTNADSLKLTGGFDIATGEDNLNVAGVNINGNLAQTFTVAHDNTTIGGALEMNLTLTNAAGQTTVGSVGEGNVSVAGGVLDIGAANQAVTLTGGKVNQTGVIGGDLDVSGGGVLAGAVAATDVLGTVTLQADAGAVTIRDAGGVVTVAGSTLNLNDAGNNMTITGGKVTQTGAIAGDLNVSGAGVLAGAVAATDVLGTVTLQAGATGIVTIKDATGDVEVAGGTLNLVDATADMTITGGKVTQTGAIGGNLDVSGGGVLAGDAAATNVTGTVTLQADAGAVAIKNATKAVAVAGGTLNLVNANANMTITGGKVTQTGTIGGNLNVSGTGSLAGAAGATDVAGAVTLQADAGAVTIKDATGDVAVAGGTLNLVDANADMTITGGKVTQTGTIGGDLDVSGGGVLAGDAAATDVAGTVTLQADAGAVAIKNATKAVAVAGGTLNLVDATADMTITGGKVTQTGTIGGDLDVSGGGVLAGDAAATDVTGTVTLQASAGTVTIRDALNAAAVSVAGGTLNLHNAAGGINFTGNADATVNVAAGGNVNAVNNTTGGDGIGILNFTAAGDAGAVGATNSLKEVRFSGAAVVTLGVVKATNINFADAAVVNATGNITANIDFKNNDGVISLDDGVNITGTVGSTLGANGTLSFLGSSTVTETIGGAAIAELKLIQARGDGGDIVNLNKDVSVTDLKFTPAIVGPASTIKIGGNLTGNVTFYAGDNNGGILEFNGNALNKEGNPRKYKFNGDIVNANNGILKVNTTLLTATSATVATLKEIQIVDAKALLLDVSKGDVTLPAIQTIIFQGADSGLGFTNDNVTPRQIIFSGDFAAPGDNQGKLLFFGGNDANVLTIISDDPANTWKIGDLAAAARFAKLSVFDEVVVDKTINLSGIVQLDVVEGTNFVDYGATTAQITTINIGTAYPLFNTPNAGPAAHTIDVTNAAAAAVALLGDNVKFADADSTFTLQSTYVGNSTVTLGNNIVGGVGGGAAAGGIVELNADNANTVLIIEGGKTLGTEANPLQTLMFTGNGKIDLSPGGGTKFYATNLNLGVTAIKLGDIAQHLEFSGNTILTATGNITSVDFKGNNATINMDTGKNITGAVTNTGVATNNGTIEFKGTGQIGGNISGLAMLKVGAGAVELKTGGATKITEIQGTGTDTLTLPENFKLTGAINLTGGKAVKLNFKGGTNSISGIVGTQANPVGGIITAGTTTFTGAVNSKGPITTAGNTTFSNSLNNIGDVTTTGTTIFTGAYTNAGTAKFGGTTNFASTFNNTGAVTTAGTTIYTGAYTNKGAATFGGTTSFADTFNNTGTVTLAPGSINNFAKNVTATSFVASDATMNFSKSLAFNSDITGSGTTINLNSGQLAYTGQGSFSDKLIIATTYDQTRGNIGGNIVIKAGSKLDLSQVSALEIQFTAPDLDINKINKDTKYQLIIAETSGGLVPTLANIDFIVNGQEFTNAFVKWSIDTSSLTLSATNISNDVIGEELTKGALKNAPADTKEAVEILERAIKGSEADQFKNTLDLIIKNEPLVTQVIDSLQLDTVRTGDAVAAVNTQATSGAITSAITSLSSRMNNLQVANNQAAVAAGEEDEAKFGIWATPFVGNSTQKMRNNVNGNKSNFNGATVGFDGMLNDNLVLGVAYTRANSKIKQKNDKIGDSSKVNSNIYSIYGLYNLPTNNLFFEAVGSYGDSRVKNYTKHLLPTARNTITSQIAHGKYKSRSYTGQVMVGYDYVTAQANLTPMAGIRYSNIKDSGYTETGTTLQNLIVKGKKYNIVEGLAGAKISTNVNVDQVILTPELYGLINYGFKNKAPAIDARLQGMDAPFPTNSFKTPKVSYNLGTGVTAKYQMMEYGINYDVNIASKYFAQQGSLKVRVNF